MKIHHLRNATCILEFNNQYIIVDPMLGPKGSLPPFAWFKFPAKRNPLVDLPPNSLKLLNKVNHCLITHSQKWGIPALQHTDHLDKAGIDFLTSNSIPVTCPVGDGGYFKKRGLSVVGELEYWDSSPYLNGSITAIPAQHGHGWNRKFMANGAGFFISIPNQPSVYIAGDTVLTEDVKKALHTYKPDISILACGSAQLDIGPPILMNLDEILTFLELSPGIVLANHLDALNHCPTTRIILKNSLQKHAAAATTYVPDDGETLIFT